MKDWDDDEDERCKQIWQLNLSTKASWTLREAKKTNTNWLVNRNELDAEDEKIMINIIE